MGDFQTVLKKDASTALAHGARELTFALHQEYRRQPPRPREGTITTAAKTRGWSMNVLSRSYLAGYTSALRTLGGNNSGYFRIVKIGDRIQAVPLVLGKKRRLIKSGRKHFRQRGALLTSASELNDSSSLPGDAVKLNVGSLAVVRALGIRERAALGGYLSVQWLTYKKIKVARNISRSRVLAKNNALAGEVIPKTAEDGNASAILISGYLPGTLRVAQRFGILNRVGEMAARNSRAYLSKTVARRAQRLISGVKSGTHVFKGETS
jgi:hypothetical protein